MRVYHLIIHILGKVQDPIPQREICSMSNLKTFLNVPVSLKIITERGLRSKC